MSPDRDQAILITAIRKRAARAAVGASTVRGQGSPGFAAAAREYLAAVPLAQFGITKPTLFRTRLDRATEDQVSALPKRGRSWGIARKVLNIFLRDALYNCYLRDHFHLSAGEGLYELPLDSITAKHLIRQVGKGYLPRWPGVKYLTPEVSDQYQAAAAALASTKGLARVHLDAFWWGGDRE